MNFVCLIAFIFQALTLPLNSNSKLDTLFYYPESVISINQDFDSSANSLRDLGPEELIEMSLDTIVEATSIARSELRISRNFTDTFGVFHVYFDRLFQGYPVLNHNAAVHIKNGQISYMSASFHASRDISLRGTDSNIISLENAISIAENALGIPKDSTKPYKSLIQIDQKHMQLAYFITLRNDDVDKWMRVAIDTSSGKIVQVVDYTRRLTYKAIPFSKRDPTDGFDDIKDPEDTVASPLGWINDGNTTFNDTRGNNFQVSVSSPNLRGNLTDGTFNSTWNSSDDPKSAYNRQAAAVQLFFLLNKLHDIFYHYGFTEAAGNFQNFNFGKGGSENDAVHATIQAPFGANNAIFNTPPDGESGMLKLYLFTKTNPKRDPSLELAIPIHEMTHGLSKRLTGGSRNAMCLDTPEASGLGEGWSDAVAMYLLRSSKDDRNTGFTIGNYVLNSTNGNGLRQFKYTSDMKMNPYTFSFFNQMTEEHGSGEIWATMLNELYWNLVEKLGYSENWYDAKQNKGNIVAMQLVIGGMMLQPCNPNFSQARDAILQADVNYYKGANKCEIWKAFAKRGLGVDSNQSNYTDGFKLPPDC